MSRRKDPQKRAVYEWQWDWTDWNHKTIGWRETKRLIRAACRVFDVPPPTIFKISKDYSYAKGGRIGITKDHQNVGVALHEAAHHIVQVIAGKQPDGSHGRLFVGVWLALLVHFQAAPRVAIESSLRDRGIRWTRVKKKASRSR